ncbi:MAG: translation initiation factor eIF-2B [Sulfolobales archaeon]
MCGKLAEFWKVYGATEAAKSILEEFLRRINSPRSWEDLLDAIDYLYEACSARPYSALLINASRDILQEFLLSGVNSVSEAVNNISSKISRVFENVENMTIQAASIASRRIQDDEVIFTISYSGTVLKVFQNLIARGARVRAIVAESRPFGEGVEMARALRGLGVDVTLIVDSAIRSFIKRASRVVIGAEAIAANGAIINKIGTALLAIASKEARVRLFVVSGSYKIVPETFFGELVDTPEIEIQDVPQDLISMGVKTYAPLFEAIPAEYIDAIITEKGLISPPAIPYVVRETFGSWPPRVRRVEDLYREARSLILERLRRT